MPKRKSKGRLLALAVVGLLLLAGCRGQILYNYLTQQDANKIMVLLAGHGIDASLETEVIRNETFWVVLVKRDSLQKAREIIVTSNIISPRAPGLKDVYQASSDSGSWIKTPAEERARYILAVKGEVINALKALPEVVEADVVLNIPEEPKLGSREKKRPTAAVVVKALRPEAGESALSDLTIQQWVANTVEGLSPRDVTVLINYSSPPGEPARGSSDKGLLVLPPGSTPQAEQGAGWSYVMGLKLKADSAKRLKLYLIIFFAVLVVISLALVMSIIQSGRTRQELKQLKSGSAPPHPAIEGEVMGGRPPQLGAGQTEEEEEDEEI